MRKNNLNLLLFTLIKAWFRAKYYKTVLHYTQFVLLITCPLIRHHFLRCYYAAFLASVRRLPCPVSPSICTLASSALNSCCAAGLAISIPVVDVPKAELTLAISYRRLASPPKSSILRSILLRYCYCGPRMEPGLAILIHPMKAAGGKPKCFIQYKPIKVPVLPRPALQWMAIAPGSYSAAVRNYGTTSSGGAVPSMKKRSICLIPCFVNFCFSYWGLFKRTTRVTPRRLKMGT